MEPYHPFEEVGQGVQGFGINLQTGADAVKKTVADAKTLLDQKRAEWAQRSQGDRLITINPAKTGDVTDPTNAVDPTRTLTAASANQSLRYKAVEYVKANPGKTLIGLAVLAGTIYLISKSDDHKPSSLSGLPARRKRRKTTAKSSVKSNTGGKKRTPAPRSKKVRTVNF